MSLLCKESSVSTDLLLNNIYRAAISLNASDVCQNVDSVQHSSFWSSKCINNLQSSSSLFLKSSSRHLGFLSQVMDLPPWSRLITSLKRRLRFNVKLFLKEVMTDSKKRPTAFTYMCVFSSLFILLTLLVRSITKKMLSAVQTTSAVELLDALPADAALLLIKERFNVWQTKTIYLVKKCVCEPRKRLRGCLPNHLKTPREDRRSYADVIFIPNHPSTWPSLSVYWAAAWLWRRYWRRNRVTVTSYNTPFCLHWSETICSVISLIWCHVKI